MTISTTIKRKYLDMILRGDKQVEFKGDTPYWHKRLHKLVGYHNGDIDIVFVCGHQAIRFEVQAIMYLERPTNIDGVDYEAFYSIALGERLKDNNLKQITLETVETESVTAKRQMSQ